MATLTRSITVAAPAEKVYEYAQDISRFWHWEDVTLSDVHVEPEGVGTSARMHTHVLGFPVAGGIEYIEATPGERIVAKVHFFAEKPTWTFTFEPAGDGTKVTAEGEWSVGVPVVGKPFETRMVKEHEPYLEGFLDHLKADVETAPAG